MFPPEAMHAGGKKGAVLARLLRPELVAKNPVPLSSDAFTRFGWADAKLHNQEVNDATQRLFAVAIPAFAKTLDEDYFKFKLNAVSDLRLAKKLHVEGINIRFMGRCRNLCASNASRKLLLHNMVTRSLKTVIRSVCRDTHFSASEKVSF